MPNVGTYNFPSVIRGTAYSSKEITIDLANGPANLTGAVIRMWLIESRSNAKVTEYTTANGKIVITDATAGKFTINFGIVTLAPATYLYDIKIIFAGNIPKTWIKGSFTVVKERTP